MKKILTGLVAGIMALSFVACNGNETAPLPEGGTPTGGNIDLTEALSAYGVEAGGYDGIEITVAQTKDIKMPGDKFTINVTIKNTGDKDIIFAMGSGANTVPDALLIVGRNLKRDLGTGASTADFQVDTLPAGEEVTFAVDVELPEELVIPADVGEFADPNAVVLLYTVVQEGEEINPAFAPTTYSSVEFPITLTIPSESK